jgi:hypothetical protein
MDQRTFLASYKTLAGQKPYKRIAHFLASGAKALPGVFFDHEMIARAINGYKPNARIDQDEKTVVQNSMSRAYTCLRRDYKLGYDSKPGVGARATVGSDDTYQNCLRPSLSRLNSQHQRVNENMAIINPQGFKDPVNRRQFKAAQASALLSPRAGAELKKLLPAPPAKGE